MISNRLNFLKLGILFLGILVCIGGCTDTELDEVRSDEAIVSPEMDTDPPPTCLTNRSYNRSVFHDGDTPIVNPDPNNNTDEWDWVRNGVRHVRNEDHIYKVRGFPGAGFNPGDSYRNIYWNNRLSRMKTEWKNVGNGREFHSKIKRQFKEFNFPITVNNASVRFTAELCGITQRVDGEDNESQLFIESFATVDSELTNPPHKNELNVWLYKRDVTPWSAKEGLIRNGYTQHSQDDNYFYLYYYHEEKNVFKMRAISKSWIRRNDDTISGTYDIDGFWKYFLNNPESIDEDYQLTGREILEEIGFGINAKRPSIGQAQFTDFTIHINGN